ncbi:hypothetical protein VE03_07071 [Pseudogymnoascus sp. 23342-1-I1]|nr:hypothetical protein VE03_07071 [Pseudogymnoascus sp. 23342-1-I1]
MISPFSVGLSLLFLTTTAQAASSISLGGNFQGLPFGITGECRKIYNSPIENCSSEDFQSGGACSQACVASLESISNTLNTACPGVIVDSRTLLGRIFQNKLIESVCDTVEVSSQSVAPTEIATSPTATPVTTSQEPPQSTTTEAPPTTTSEETSKSSAGLGIGDPDPTSESTSESTTKSTTKSTLESTPESTTTEIQAPQTTTSSIQGEPTSRSRLQQQIDANRFSGGGSPFDNIVADSGALQARSSLLTSLAGAILVAIMLV